MTHWQEIIRKLIAPQHRVRIGVVGKYIGLQDAYKSVYEAIIHGGVGNDCGVEIVQVDAEEIEKNGAEKMLKGLGGILVPGGFGERGIEGKILAAQYARENKIPYLGLCLGMQIATIEFARNVLKLDKAHSTEFDPNTPHPVIAMLDEQKRVTKKGGTMRLGAQPCQLALGTKAAQLYGSFVVNERHRHRYEFNNAYRDKFEKAGFVFSGLSPDGKLVEVIELADHPFFIASQFHPEFLSKPHQPHPLFKGLHRRRPRAHPPETAVIWSESDDDFTPKPSNFSTTCVCSARSSGWKTRSKLAALAGNPQDRLRFIHVAGTNGKGSTCAMLESIYRAAGLRVGLFTSPHLVSFRERIQVNRQLISESEVVRLVEEIASRWLQAISGWPSSDVF